MSPENGVHPNDRNGKMRRSTKIFGAALAAVLFAGGLSVSVAGAANAVPNGNDGKVCENLSTGHIEPSDDVKSLVITAPEGKLIAEVCVKAGSVKQGNGPVYTEYDPAVESVTISHPSGKDISHYAVGYSDPECLVGETHTETTWDVETWQEVEPAKEAVAPSIVEGWKTESDDAAPTIVGSDLVFTAPGGKAVGLRHAVSYNISELTGQSYSDVFHDRAVVNIDAEYFTGAQAWRNDYLSLTFLSADTVFIPGGIGVKTLAEAKSLFPGTITSFGYHMDSNAAAGTVYTVEDSALIVPGSDPVPAEFGWVKTGSGQGLVVPADVPEVTRYIVTGTVEVTEQVPGECPLPGEEEPTPTEEPKPSEEPKPTEKPVETQKPAPAPAAVASEAPVPAALASTGLDLTPFAVGGVVLLILGAGVVLLYARGKNSK